VRFSTAIAVSVAAHCAIAAGIVAYMKYAEPTTLAALDLTSVELSFSEEEDEMAAAASALPASPPLEPPSPPEEIPPELDRPDDPLPPDPEAIRLPEPEPERERMVTPDPPRTGEAQASSSAKAAEDKPNTSDEVAQAPRQARVDAPPKPQRAIRPDYPRGARQRGEQGDVVLEIKVGADGTVDRVSVVASCGHPELDGAAVRAAKAARFTPAKAGGRSVSSTARLTLTFRLR